jgi:hypothetical protein
VFIDLLGMTHLHLAISQGKGPTVEIRCNTSRGRLRVSFLLVDSRDLKFVCSTDALREIK